MLTYVKITWGDKIGLYPLTSSYSDQPYLRVGESYLPLTTNTSNLIGVTQPRLTIGNFTYRPLRLISSSTSTSYLTTSTNSENMSDITVMSEASTTGTIYHTCASTSGEIYLTRTSAQSSSSYTTNVGYEDYVRVEYEKNFKNDKTIISVTNIASGVTGTLQTSRNTTNSTLSATLLVAGRSTSRYQKTISSSENRSQEGKTDSASGSYTTHVVGLSLASRLFTWTNAASNVVKSLSSAFGSINIGQNINSVVGPFAIISSGTSYTRYDYIKLTFKHNKGTSQTLTNYTTCASTYSTEYLTRTSTSRIEYLTTSTLYGYSGVFSSSSSTDEGWI